MKQHKHKQSITLRRSVALPATLVGELKSVAPPELRNNLNRLVIISLQDYILKRRQLEFANAMAEMAADPQIQAECKAIAKQFSVAESDGLRND